MVMSDEDSIGIKILKIGEEGSGVIFSKIQLNCICNNFKVGIGPRLSGSRLE